MEKPIHAHVTGSLVLEYNIFKNKQTYLKIKHIDIINSNNLLSSQHFQTVKTSTLFFHLYSNVTAQH